MFKRKCWSHSLIENNDIMTSVRASEIHGSGLFATKEYYPGDFVKVLYGTKNGKLYYDKGSDVAKVNHQFNGNVILRNDPGGDYGLYASKYIHIGDEIVYNYETGQQTLSPSGYASYRRGEWKELNY